MKIRPVGPELFSVDGWTDGQLIVFPQFYEST